MGGPSGRGRGGPRVGGRKGDLYRIGGVDVAWDPELDVDKPKPAPLFPAYAVEQPKPLSEKETRQVERFISFREAMREGPLYTVLGDNARVSKPGIGNNVAATFDSFNGMPKYSARYAPKRRGIQRLDYRKFELRFFPQELWSTLNPNLKETRGAKGALSERAQKLRLEGLEKAEALEGEEKVDEGKGASDEEDDDEDDDSDGLGGGGGGGGGKKKRGLEELGDEETLADEYDEDEEGDYNAEQYFQDGVDDEGDDGGGDEGGGDYF